MKSIFDSETRNELAARVRSLGQDHKAHWGKMNAYQMLKHCTMCDDMYHGDVKIKRGLIGMLFGQTVLKKVLKDETPFQKNAPTSIKLKTMGESGNIESQKKEWLTRLAKYENYNTVNFVHPFFGPMTREQVGWLAYKHADHHLRQFGV